MFEQIHEMHKSTKDAVVIFEIGYYKSDPVERNTK